MQEELEIKNTVDNRQQKYYNMAMKVQSVGSVCSGIEAASVVRKGLNYDFKWFSEIAGFQSRFLAYKYPQVKNLGDMNFIPDLLVKEQIEAPDLICGGLEYGK